MIIESLSLSFVERAHTHIKVAQLFIERWTESREPGFAFNVPFRSIAISCPSLQMPAFFVREIIILVCALIVCGVRNGH